MVDSLNKIEISLSALCRNFSLLKARSTGDAVLAMVKADAYGHGMEECAKALAEVGADCFGVAEVVEGEQLRGCGIRQPIFIMAGILPELIGSLFDHQLTPVIVDDSCLELLSAEAVQRDCAISIHLKVDAGMGRQGCALSEVGSLIENIVSLPGLILEGIMTHFPMSDDPDSASTKDMTAAFCSQLEHCHELLPKNIQLHLANSGGILYFPASHRDMIRPGISLYGYYPNGRQGIENAGDSKLEPAMRFISRVIQVKDVPAGSGLGYGHTFTTRRRTRVAIIPVGYEDGYLRCLSNRAEALIHGCRVPSVGRISMNLTMYDVTDLTEVKPGDEVVLLGSQGDEEITADDIAGWMDSISYEVLCLFGNLNNRVYVEPEESYQVSAISEQLEDL